MPNTQRQRAPSPDPNDIEADFDPKLTRLGRDGGHRPPAMLQVTTQLHPFWHTKRGIAIIVLVVLALVGAVVGGVIGGTKGRNDGSKKDLGMPQVPATAPATTSSTTNSTTKASKSTTTRHSSSAAKTTTTALAARAYPIRRQALGGALPSAILSLAGITPVITPAMIVQVEPTMTPPPSSPDVNFPPYIESATPGSERHMHEK